MNPRPSPVYAFVAVLTWPLVRGLFRLSVRGGEHLPRDGGYVLAANHTSNFDPWPLGMPLFPRRYLRFMAKAELFWPPLGWFIRGAGGFKVHRGRQDAEAIETAVELARAGHVVAMFPEGTRRRKGLRKKLEARPRSGAARIALEAGVPLVPAAVTGTDGLARFAKLKVAYGEAIPLDDLAGLDLRDAAQEATDRLMAAIAELEGSLA